MTPKSQAKIKPQFPQYPFLTIFNPKKVSCEQIYVLITLWGYIVMCIIMLYIPWILFAHFKHKGKYIITMCIPKLL